MYESLSHFIKALEEKGQLAVIEAEVDPELEIAEIINRMNLAPKGGRAVLFKNVKGSKMPLLINAFGSEKRMAMSLGVSDLQDIQDRITGMLTSEMPTSFMGKLKKLPQLKELSSFAPKLVKTAPCQEVVITENPSLDIIPAIKCWPKDGGSFITLPLVHTKDPISGIRNAGMYRLQVFDSQSLGMHWHIHKHGAKHLHAQGKKNKPLEVAISIGPDPATTFAAAAPLPDDTDEMVFAGFLRKSPVELVKCKTVDLEVPADAQIILEGTIDPEERQAEGPFGDHTGFYSRKGAYPVFRLRCITHRKNPIYQTTVTGKPPREDCYIAKACQKIFFPILKRIIPELVDMNLPMAGGFHNLAVVSIDKRYPAQAQKVMHAIWGLGQMMITKIVIVMDKDVNVQDMDEVIWHLGNNIDPKLDISFVHGPIDELDHASRRQYVSSKMGIDATRKLKEEGFKRSWPKQLKMDKDVVKTVTERWKEYGLPPLSKL